MHYYELEPENNTFKTISIQTTYMCQLKCSNCYLGDMLNNPKYPDVDIDRFEDTMKRLKGRCDIRFIGAEPTLNKNLPKLISIARKNGHIHLKHAIQKTSMCPNAALRIFWSCHFECVPTCLMFS